jgi:hypothetical protein
LTLAATDQKCDTCGRKPPIVVFSHAPFKHGGANASCDACLAKARRTVEYVNLRHFERGHMRARQERGERTYPIEVHPERYVALREIERFARAALLADGLEPGLERDEAAYRLARNRMRRALETFDWGSE